MWAGLERQRDAIAAAGLDLAPGELLADAAGEGAELEGITAVLLLTDEDDFNALAVTTLQGTLDGPVYRVAPPRHTHGVVAPYATEEVPFPEALTRVALDSRHHEGVTFIPHPAADPIPASHDLLFLIHPNGQLTPVTEHTRPTPAPGDTLVLLTGPRAR